MVVNNRVNGFNVGLELCSSHTRVRFNDFSGNRSAGIRVQGSPALITLFNAKRNPTDPYDLDFFRNDLQNNGNAGILVGGGRYVRFDENWMGNNDSFNQGYSGFQTYYSKGPTSVGASSTTSLINTASLGTNNYTGYSIYIPALGISTKVSDNTATTITLSPALSADPNGYTYTLVPSIAGEWFVGKNYFFDNGTAFTADKNSLLPTQNITVAGTPFFIDSPVAETFKIGQVVTLVGVLEGPADLLVKVAYFDKKYPDRIWMKAISSSPGAAEVAVATPFIQTAGTAITAGTGTISSASTYTLSKDPGVALPLVGSGTEFTTQMDRRAWVKANGEWFKITKVTTDTAAYSDGRITAPFSGQSYVISTFTITGT
ncbi:MAG: hypothetical protein Q7U75_18340, partial [Desulfobacterales bacterium]|nr:hypothetical protein [Desulfobacterales bacterium]